MPTYFSVSLELSRIEKCEQARTRRNEKCNIVYRYRVQCTVSYDTGIIQVRYGTVRSTMIPYDVRTRVQYMITMVQ
jgi:hypothetical protein